MKGFEGRWKVKWLPRWHSDKESACQVGHVASIPGSERSPGEGNGHPLRYTCLGNPMDRGAWGATVYGVAKSGRTEGLSDWAFTQGSWSWAFQQRSHTNVETGGCRSLWLGAHGRRDWWTMQGFIAQEFGLIAQNKMHWETMRDCKQGVT